MAGIKTFINTTEASLQMILFVRAGEEVYNQADAVPFTLGPLQTLDVSYGNDSNGFLNGILLFTIFQGSLYSKIQFATERGQSLDNALNTNSIITIILSNTDYVFEFSN
ncbi:hypothetical protein [Paenibacillus sp. OV219]|uniref:hypothetical protein n=1 Tax=Paenibacillus sp. OV219 TaxID=1884377 RepID=UPI0008C0C03C|nr:hypothetical protein [Paenibacillus sp. OV219]SEO95375.1 hypothetical protein SAMN05518847_11386 [Paenibacillus sp. OV219]